jgi:hypothetical protein
MQKNLLLLLTLSLSFSLTAQPKLNIPRNLQNTYSKGTRSPDGKPGKKYWQNTADYDLKITFDPASRLIKGSVSIDYYNNSPDTLREIQFKLYPNYYKKGSPRLHTVKAEDVGEGLQIETISAPGTSYVTYKIDATIMTVSVPPVTPKQVINFFITYNYTLNKGSHMRTGQVEENAAFIAYFFPRIAVYDDIDGWDKNQYLGTHEFYNDFCNFKASINVPKDFVVWATGDLQNCSEVLNQKYCTRIHLAETSDSVITIIDTTDLENEIITSDNSPNTWKFEAKNVTDFVFATSNHYIWKSSSIVVDKTTKRRTRVDAVFNPKHKDYFEVINFNRQTVNAMSLAFPKWPFPYSHETIFDGLDQMEYPMMANDNPVATREDAITLTVHEVFHTIFPFYLGINETKYAWMDEGWATLGEWLISPGIDSTIKDSYGMPQYNYHAGKEIDLPITILTTQQSGVALFINSYPKPALGYLYVRDLLGDGLFLKALHFYINQWHGKHPMPYDFFNCMNTGSGRNLDWFWKRWFFDNGVPDLAIISVKKKAGNFEIVIESKGTKPVPIDLDIHFDDNSILKEHRNIGVWERGNNTVTISIPANKSISNISLGSLYTPDINTGDNVYIASK